MTDIAAMEQQAADLARQIEAAKAEKLRVERQERQAKAAQERAAHYTKMYAEIGQPLAGLNEAQHGIVYSQAWESGHGFSEVESHYGDLAEMARAVIYEDRISGRDI